MKISIFLIKRRKRLEELIVVKDKSRLKSALESLEKEEVDILSKYFFLKSDKIYSIEELAQEAKLTNSKMRERIMKIIDKLNELMQRKMR